MSMPDGLDNLNQRRTRRPRQVLPPRHQPKTIEAEPEHEEPVIELADAEVVPTVEPPPALATKPSSRRSSASKQLDNQSLSYERKTVFVRPDQWTWVKTSKRAFPDGLSASDVVRYALDELIAKDIKPVELIAELTRRAHEDAEHFGGRKNRGLPSSR